MSITKTRLNRIAGWIAGAVLMCVVLIVILTLLGPSLAMNGRGRDDGSCAKAVSQAPNFGAQVIETFDIPQGHPVITAENLGRIQELETPPLVDIPFVYSLRFSGTNQLEVLSYSDQIHGVPVPVISPDEKTLVLLEPEPSYPTLIRICDMTSGKRRTAWASDETTRTAVFTPDGTRMIVNEGRGTIIVYGTNNYNRIARWNVREGKDWRGTDGLAVSPDGSLAAFAINDESSYQVHIWSVDGGQELGTLPALSDKGIMDVLFSPDGTVIATMSLGGTLRFWGVPESK